MNRAACLLAVLALAACATTSSDPFPPASRTFDGTRMLDFLTDSLTGTFESVPQAAGGGDPSKVTLRVVRIWPERTGEYWFYEEFERAEEAGRPYLQRLVRAGAAGEDLAIVEYAIPGDARRLAGAWRNPRAALAGIDPRTLQEYPDCRQKVVLQNSIVFAGGTTGKACRARVPEGAYFLGEFSLSSASLRMWDRGYDPAGKVVWGSAAGPLELRRMSPQAQ